MMRTLLGCLAFVVISGMASIGILRAEEEKGEAVPLEKLPKAVTDAVKKMFPKAELISAIKEEEVEEKEEKGKDKKEAKEKEEDDEVEYEVTIKENGKKIDVTVHADGKIEAFEKEIDLKDLPRAVTAALEKAQPK